MKKRMTTALLLLASSALPWAAAATTAAAAAADLPPASSGQTVRFDVHEGTSMAVSVSPDGRSLAIDLQGSLWIVPARGGRARRITDYFSDARQPVWSPDGKRLAFFAYRDGDYDLWTIAPDGSDMRKLTEGLADDREPAWSPDGKRIAFSSDRAGKGAPSYNIWTLDLASGALVQVTSDPGEDRLPSWSADGREIAFSRTNAMQSSLFAADAATGSERALKPGTHVEAPSWSPTGALAAVVADAQGSHLDLDGTAVSGAENVFPFRASWTRDGKSFYYVSDGRIRRREGSRTTTVPFAAELAVTRVAYPRAKRDFDSTAPRRALGILKPTLSPDGRTIAFIAIGDLWTVPVTGGTPTNLTKDHAMDTDPSWSPDGSRIAYSSDKGGGLPQLWIRDLKTGRDRQLTDVDTQPLGAAWSPDGTRIAYIDADGRWGVAGLCVVEVATGRITRLQPSLPQPGDPTWSADGKYVALSLSRLFSKSFREGTNQIFLVPADGKGEPRWVAPDPDMSIDTRGGGGPAWSPDGTKMAAIYEGLLKIWPVTADGTPVGPPRSYTAEMSHHPAWAGDSRTILFQASDRLKTIDTATGVVKEVPLALSYTLAKPSGRTVIHAGAMVDSVHDVTQTNKDIVVEGNRIVAIRDHDPALHANAKVVDGSGLTAIPGLIEHHSHAQKDFGAAGNRAWLAYGITTVRDPGAQLYDGIENREANEAGVRIGPRIYSGGPLLEWARVYYKMGVAVSGPAHLDRELELGRALKYDMIKSYVRMTDFGQRRIVEAAHDMGIPVSGHEIFPAAYSGVDATEHMGATSRRGYSPKQGPGGMAYEDVIQLMGKSGRTITPTLFGSLTPFLTRHPEFRADPRLRLYPKWAQETVTGTDPMAVLIGPILAGSMKGVKAAYDAGALIAAGTDTLISINLLSEIAAYVDAGLTPFQALQTATVNAAKSLNLDAGTLEPGKLADIVLIKGDPRADIAATFNVRTVIANGVVYTPEALLQPAK